MNIFGHLKKIFNSYDFMGNRIKRLRVDTPENFIDDKHPEYRANPQYRTDLENNSPDEIANNLGIGADTKYNETDYERYKDFVANKDYVDKRTTYKSERAKNQESANNITSNQPIGNDLIDGRPGPEEVEIYPGVTKAPNRTPSQFPWMNGVYGKPHEEVLDELLYPRIPHKYQFPVITEIKIRTNELMVECLEQYSKTNKYLVMAGVGNDIKFDIKIDAGEWNNASDAHLIFVKSDGTQLHCNNQEFTENSNSCSTVIAGITHAIANLVNFIYHKDIVKVIFRQKYNGFIQKYDTWGYPTIPECGSSYCLETDITEEFFKQCYVFGLKVSDTPNQIGDYSFNRIDYISDINNTTERYLYVESPISEDYYIECLIYNAEDNQLLNTTIINQKEISPEGFIKYNFGYFPMNVYIKFRPIPVSTQKGFVQND